MTAAEPHDGPGDLGRRIAARRAELGLRLDEVAAASGMDPSYLRRLESEPMALASVSVLRGLARALRTTPAALLGATTFRPPGADVPGGAGELRKLSEDECWHLLGRGGVGRVVFDSSRGPLALPVNFAVVDRTVVFRTLEDGVIAGVTAPGVAGFEVDHIDDARRQAWSVLLTGHVRRPREDEVARLRSLEVTPWAGGDRNTHLLFEATEVTGRCVVPER